MKKTILSLLVTFTIIIIGCDKEMVYDYIIHNKHNKTIVVEFETYDIPYKVLSIDQGNIDTIYSFSIIEGTQIYERKIIFNSFNIKSDTIESEIDYLSNDSWEYIKKSDTYAVYYLEVDSTNFE